ncbi:Fic family protein [Mediterraneibacter gnavus]|uniref:Fic family protein n=1 Tax=Mediterraneibacter gnavus TaxID=33038 RepID=UPI0023311859|nr:Fic family protein [Mediterraneibacter gnavus]MDB8703369.1 Fic family protein [Mediterraneibacter gnavus]MDB8710715.1 Fic family protein [Mediterraneibacter gnavus]MDB8713218.1 Fic family protein [Mediterraneibacter gnavus]MDB8715752.1 Fic family protein [Mediterraneibacter gnavus]
MMQDKFFMEQQDNLFYAKRNIVDSIYSQSKLEGIAVTFPEVQEIYEGRSVAGLSVEELIKINNLKHGWKMMFATVNAPFDFQYIQKLNQKVGEGIVIHAGKLRNSDVSIGGTSWKPEIPIYKKIEAEIQAIMNADLSVTERAITIMLYIMHSQMFFDGNKRTAQLAANQIMIQGGAGVLRIPVECQKEFFTKLIGYYETGNMREVKRFVYDTSIDGFVKKQTEQPEISAEMFRKAVPEKRFRK